ncbi:MAG: thiamine-phosphate kinase [Flavobacteriales bacterium]|nr:thiamine-phosphate kinase [Flavobacteriales bacterium]
MNMEENLARTELKDLGEFKLIKHLTDQLKIKNSSTILGVGDDAAILDYGDREIVVSTDMLIEGVHFDMVFNPLKHLGYKAVVVNLSDIYAMNAQPRQITVSLALSSKFSVEAVEEIYAGMILAGDIYGVDIVGGDTTSSNSGLIISITALGEIKKSKAVLRSGAKETDLLVVSGDLGGAYMGLQLLNREKEVWKANPKMQPDLDGYDYILERQLKPEARKDIVKLLAELNVTPTSMIDVSDGLSSGIKHICDQSKVGVELYEDKIPIDPTTYQLAIEFNLDPTLCALSGGEDYELLFTISIKDFDKIKGNPSLTVIGHMTAESSGMNMVTKGGTSVALQAQGWDGMKGAV